MNFCPTGEEVFSKATKYRFAEVTARFFGCQKDFYQKFGSPNEYKESNPAFDNLITFIEDLLSTENGSKS